LIREKFRFGDDMDIRYMKLLQDNPFQSPGASFDTSIESFDDPKTGIKQLEDEYNQDTKFPKAFRELLFIAGEYCWAPDYDRCNDKYLVKLSRYFRL
jgi:hypothetical protein